MTRREIRECAFYIIFESSLRDDPVEELYKLAEDIGEIESVLEHKEEIDNIISLYSTKRTISRIPKVSLAILRIAVYEALYDELTPVNAAISEAVLLSQAFSYKEDTGFVNGVLSSFAKNISEEKSLNA